MGPISRRSKITRWFSDLLAVSKRDFKAESLGGPISLNGPRFPDILVVAKSLDGFLALGARYDEYKHQAPGLACDSGSY